jgi:ferredoxin
VRLCRSSLPELDAKLTSVRAVEPTRGLAWERAVCEHLARVSLQVARRWAQPKALRRRGGVEVSWYVHGGTRVLEPECTLCQTCVTSCPEGNLGLSLGLDLGTTRLPPAPPPRDVLA